MPETSSIIPRPLFAALDRLLLELLSATRVALPPDVAWRLFTKGMRPAEVRPLVGISGDAALAETVLKLVAVMG